MIEKINVWRIVRDHISTLKDYGTDKYSPGDLVLFFGVPFLAGVGGALLGSGLRDSVGTLLVTGLSVFGALLFNLLLLLYDIVIRPRPSQETGGLTRLFLEHLYSNISFSLLICVLTLVAVLLSFLTIWGCWAQRVFGFLTCYLTTLFFLTLLMVLKRIHVLLSKELGSR